MADVSGEACVVVDDCLDVGPLRAAIRASRLIGDSQLTTVPVMTRRMRRPLDEGGGFTSTRGFGVVCHADAVDEAIEKVPLLVPFVPLALDEQLRRRVRPMSTIERLGAAVFDDVNALYLNVLVVPPGAAVDRHTDATLGTVPDDRAPSRRWWSRCSTSTSPTTSSVASCGCFKTAHWCRRSRRKRALRHVRWPPRARSDDDEGDGAAHLVCRRAVPVAAGAAAPGAAGRVQSNGFAEVMRRFPPVS